MKRSELLLASFSEEKNQESLIKDIQSSDNKFIKRAIRSLEDQIEDLEEELKNRLKSKTPIDDSTILVTYAGIKEKKNTLQLYKDFKEDFLQ